MDSQLQTQIVDGGVGFAVVRLNTVTDELEERDFECELRLDGEGMPYLLAKKGDHVFRFTYYEADEEYDAYVLNVSMIIDWDPSANGIGEDVDEFMRMFNHNSIYGMAEFFSEENLVELRVQSLEQGGMNEGSYYEKLTELLLMNEDIFLAETVDFLSDGD